MKGYKCDICGRYVNDEIPSQLISTYYIFDLCIYCVKRIIDFLDIKNIPPQPPPDPTR